MSIKLEELLKKKEPLDPELQEYKDSIGVRHPLVYCIFYTPQQNALLNAQLKSKKEQLEIAISTEDWSSYIWLHEKPYRVGALSRLKTRFKIPDKKFWELFGSVWTDSENIWQNRELWILLLSFPGDRESAMEAEELEVLKGLPNKVTIYRGTREGFEHGLSWTLSKSKAKWFAERFYIKGDRKFGKPVVLEGTIPKTKIVAYFNGRKEDEIVVCPSWKPKDKK